MVTGGLGFIGSNLTNRLVELGAEVTVVDSSIPGCGANLYNIASVQRHVRLIPLDLADAAQFADEIAQSDLIFNLAGEISHTWSMKYPERDMRINAVAQLRFLQVCKAARPGIRIIFGSTRQVYGRPEYLPVDETHPVRAVDFNGVHKLAASQYHALMSSRGEIEATTLRLTNVYGPRMALHLPWQGFLAVFARAALRGEPLSVYGEGRQIRDPLFVGDAVNAFLLAGAAERLASPVYNVGGAEPLTLLEIAEGFARHSDAPIRHIPFPPSRKSIDIGDYYTDCSLVTRELGWEPRVGFAHGVRRTLDYYRSHLERYLEIPVPEPVCNPCDVGALLPTAVQ